MMDADRLGASLAFAPTLRAESVRTLCKQVRVLSVPPQASLLQPGDAVSGVYFVERGSIRVYYLDAEGHEGTLYRIGPGESCILALNCLFSQMAYPAWAEAGDDGADFVTLDGGTAGQLLSEDRAFMKALFAQVSSRLYDLLSTLEAAIRLPLEARLVRLLIELAGEGDTVRLSQERLARHLGTSREVVSRLLRGLAAAGLIESAHRRIRLSDRPGLERRGSPPPPIPP